MSWTQVHVSGLEQTLLPADDELEQALLLRYNLDEEGCAYTWAGPGTTIIKRDDDSSCCRGYCFLSFFTADGAGLAVNRINNIGTIVSSSNSTATEKCILPHSLRLCAEISEPKKRSKNKSKKKNESASGNNDKSGNHISDLRLRRRRAAPARKHPVKVRKNCSGPSKPATK